MKPELDREIEKERWKVVEGIKVKKDRDTKYYRERERERDQNLTQ